MKDLKDVLGFQRVSICDFSITRSLFLENNEENGLAWGLMKVATYWYLKGIRAERAYRRTRVKEWALNFNESMTENKKGPTDADTSVRHEEVQAEKPFSSSLFYHNVPREMKAYNNWLVVKVVKNGKKLNKIPYSPITLKKANAVQNCGTFEQAMKALESGKFYCLGFQFSGTPFTGIDLDHHVKAGALDEMAMSVFMECNSYTEFSPSGTGIHIIVKGELNVPIVNHKEGIEAYSEGRYFTITGKRLGQIKGVYERQDALNLLTDTFSAQDERELLDCSDILNEWNEDISHTQEEIDQLIEKMAFHDKSGKFKKLFYNGDLSDYNGDHSAADMALLCILAYWTYETPQLIHDIFNQSALAKRDKWQYGNTGHNPKYYRQLSINKAIAFVRARREEKIYRKAHRLDE